jgi:GTP-binding protein YchF
MKVALIGLPGSGKTTLFGAVTGRPVEALPGVPGAPPHVAVVPVRDERLEWLRDLFRPKKFTPAGLMVEDHPGIPPGSAKADRRGELFARMRNADGLALVLRAFASDRYAYEDPAPDPARDLELVALEFLTGDLEICERRLERLAEEWKRPADRERVERERAAIERVRAALLEGRGAWQVELRDDEERLLKGFQLLTRKPVVLVTNHAEGAAGAEELVTPAFDVRARFAACVALEAELTSLQGEERALFLSEYGIGEPVAERFVVACYRGLGLRSFFTVGEDEVRAWTIRAGETAVDAAAAIHTELAKGFIKAEVFAYADLREAGSMRELKARNKLRLEGKEYVVADGDIVHIRSSL